MKEIEDVGVELTAKIIKDSKGRIIFAEFDDQEINDNIDLLKDIIDAYDLDGGKDFDEWLIQKNIYLDSTDITLMIKQTFDTYGYLAQNFFQEYHHDDKLVNAFLTATSDALMEFKDKRDLMKTKEIKIKIGIEDEESYYMDTDDPSIAQAITMISFLRDNLEYIQNTLYTLSVAIHNQTGKIMVIPKIHRGFEKLYTDNNNDLWDAYDEMITVFLLEMSDYLNENKYVLSEIYDKAKVDNRYFIQRNRSMMGIPYGMDEEGEFTKSENMRFSERSFVFPSRLN